MRTVTGIQRKYEGTRLRAFSVITCSACSCSVLERKRSQIEKLLSSPCPTCLAIEKKQKKELKAKQRELQLKEARILREQRACDKADDTILSCPQCSKEFVHESGKPGRPAKLCPDCRVTSTLKDRRSYHLLKAYGVTQEWYDAKLVEQNYTCAICPATHEETRYGQLYIDHDHSTGKARGLLCQHCNHGIGKFYDNISLLENSILYLKEHSRVK